MRPLVVCIMLVNGRQPMVQRAFRAFRSQTYTNKRLLVLDTGAEPVYLGGTGPDIDYVHSPASRDAIGRLRNTANAIACVDKPDVLVHWDSDDWSAPHRLEDQVSLLQSSGADVVGYHEMVFWDTRLGAFCGAWLYSSPNPKNLLGTSLCYWARTWERMSFPPNHMAEDHLWLLKMKKISGTSAGLAKPAMIASIHGDNTCSEIKPRAKEWTRNPSADDRIGKVMAL